MTDQIRETWVFALGQLRAGWKILSDVKVKLPDNPYQGMMGALSNLAGNVMMVIILGVLLQTVIYDWFLYAVSFFEDSFAFGFVALCVFVGGTAFFIRAFIQGVSWMKGYYLLPLYGAYRGFVSLYHILQSKDVQTNFWIALKELGGLL